MCQMLGTCSRALLVKNDQGGPLIVAKWPDTALSQKSMLAAAKTTFEKKNIHLDKTEEDTFYLGYPISMKDEFWGVVVLELNTKDSASVQAVTKVLNWGITWLQIALLQQESLRIVESGKNYPPTEEQQLSFMESIIKEPSLEEAAITASNYLATEYRLKRVSLGIFEGKSLSVKAISHSISYDPASQELHNLLAAMQEASSQGVNIHCSATENANTENNIATEIKKTCHNILIQNAKLHSCQTLLLETLFPQKNQTAKRHILGAVILENTEEINAGIQASIEKNIYYLSYILSLKKDSETSVAEKIKHSLKKYIHNTFFENRIKYSIFTVAVSALLFSIFYPVNYYISNEAVVESLDKYLLTAPYDGYVAEVNYRSGDQVEKDQILLKLQDDDLNLEHRKLASELQQYQFEYDTSLANGNRLQASITNTKIDQARIQLDLIETKLQRTLIRSPVKGLILSDDINRPIGSPISQGDVLIEVAKNNAHKIVLYVDERNIAKIQVDQKGELKLTGLPDKTLQINVERITPISEIKNRRNYFRIDASLVEKPLSLHPGMTGSGKILIGKRSLIWIALHDVWYGLKIAIWY